MKKYLFILVALLLFITMFPFTAFSASASAYFTGPGNIRSGDTITLIFKLSGTGLSGASGTLSYDSNQLTLTGTKQKIAAPWAVEFNGNNFVAYDNNLTSPINGQKDLFSVSFKVKNLTAGTHITVSYKDLKASDGKVDSGIGTVSYNAVIEPPLSNVANLATLTVNNASISPAFSKDTTSYSAEVAFNVAKLDLKATAEDSKSNVTINNPSLIPGGTTNVTITVTAENGSKKSYVIKVKRAQDPNYKSSSNNNITSIEVEGFLLSPVFKPDVTNYIVWLPFETTSIKVHGKAADNKASGIEIIGGDNLIAGQDNTIKVVCSAENGDKKEYIIIAKRAAAHDGSIPVPHTESNAVSTPVKTNVNSSTPWIVILQAFLGIVLGFVAGFFVCKMAMRKS